MSVLLSRDPSFYLSRLKSLHSTLRAHLRTMSSTVGSSTMSTLAPSHEGDTQYGIDASIESLMLDECRKWAEETPFVLIAEGFEGDGWHILPEGTDLNRAEFMLIIDPVDGTRQIMYDKRSAWILSGIAPNLGHETTMEHIVIAVQTEIPTTRQAQSYQSWAVKSQGARSDIHDLQTGESRAVSIAPSKAAGVEHGFASFAKFFPAGKDRIAELETRLWKEVVEPDPRGNPMVFEDQYMASGGQLFELASGRDRFVADLRPWAFRDLHKDRRPLCCHPYDVCTELIAREYGAIVTDLEGKPLASPLDVRHDVGWIGYANESIRQQIEPTLLRLLWG